jgi:hypothetical protein
MHTEIIQAGLQSAVITAAGGKVGAIMAEALPLPQWAEYLLGPMGALAGMLGAVWWLSQRLEKADKTMRERDLKYVELIEKVTASVTQNSDMLGRSAAALEMNSAAIDHCRIKNQHKP